MYAGARLLLMFDDFVFVLVEDQNGNWDERYVDVCI